MWWSLGTLLLITFVSACFLYPVRWLFLPAPHPPGYDRLVDAIDSNSPEQVKAVIDSGVDPNRYPNLDANLQAEDDIRALLIAIDQGNLDVVRVLLDRGADPNLGDGWHTNPLSAAASNERLDLMKLLIHRGALINDDGGTSSALWRAAMDGKPKSVEFLLDRGAKPGTVTFDGKVSGLIQSLKDTNGSPEIIAILERRT